MTHERFETSNLEKTAMVWTADAVANVGCFEETTRRMGGRRSVKFVRTRTRRDVKFVARDKSLPRVGAPRGLAVFHDAVVCFWVAPRPSIFSGWVEGVKCLASIVYISIHLYNHGLAFDSGESHNMSVCFGHSPKSNQYSLPPMGPSTVLTVTSTPRQAACGMRICALGISFLE